VLIRPHCSESRGSFGPFKVSEETKRERMLLASIGSVLISKLGSAYSTSGSASIRPTISSAVSPSRSSMAARPFDRLDLVLDAVV
jgi:hypothetical protein